MMDFLDFEGRDLYFDSPNSSKVDELIHLSSEAYPDDKAEYYLLRSYFYEPDNLSVLVALYRYYYYQHQYERALNVAERALEVSGKQLGYMVGWEDLNQASLGNGVLVSMGLTRFYLLGLKASAYLLMRLDDLDGAIQRLSKIQELDPADQFGVNDLLAIARRRLNEQEIEKLGSDKVSALQSYR